uniref:Uncharacterized protein n=1 Tax=Eutreptiella gymnastica TaxID=73025 RepID=A0A7S1JDN0_9EUGL
MQAVGGHWLGQPSWLPQTFQTETPCLPTSQPIPFVRGILGDLHLVFSSIVPSAGLLSSAQTLSKRRKGCSMQRHTLLVILGDRHLHAETPTPTKAVRSFPRASRKQHQGTSRTM